MIWSVSMFSTGITTTREVRVVNWAMSSSFSAVRERPDVGHHPRDGRRGGGERRGEEGPAPLPLAPLEVPVARRDGVLARRDLVTIHRDAHRAAGVAPFGPGLLEDPVEPLALGLPFHRLRAGDHQDANRSEEQTS